MTIRALSAALAAAIIAGVAIHPATAQEKPAQEKSAQAKPAQAKAAQDKKVTPQQQKMKDCAAKWKDEKATKHVSGRAEYQKFMSGCLKG